MASKLEEGDHRGMANSATAMDGEAFCAGKRLVAKAMGGTGCGMSLGFRFRHFCFGQPDPSFIQDNAVLRQLGRR
jgi:hypothetical protein